jgi:hypothetical protein
VTRRGVSLLLGAHLLVTWLAFALRVDEFPVTWAPMYSVKEARGTEVWTITLTDRARPGKIGWRALRADRGEERVVGADLNVTVPAAGRLYFQRTWSEPPPRYRHKNSGGATLDRWLLGLPPGAPIYVANWERKLLTSVNGTLGRAPGDPDFIVALHADRIQMKFDSRTLRKLGETREVASARWRPEWDAELEP